MHETPEYFFRFTASHSPLLLQANVASTDPLPEYIVSSLLRTFTALDC